MKTGYFRQLFCISIATLLTNLSIAQMWDLCGQLTIKDSTTLIDSVFEKHVGMGYGDYYNVLMHRYYASNNYTGNKTFPDAAISAIYDNDYPAVYIGNIPILMFYPNELLLLPGIDSVTFVPRSKYEIGKSAEGFRNVFSERKIIFHATEKELTEEERKIMPSFPTLATLKRNWIPEYPLHSPIDSILVKAIGFTLSQYFNWWAAISYLEKINLAKRENKHQTLKNVLLPRCLSFFDVRIDGIEFINPNTKEKYLAIIEIDNRTISYFPIRSYPLLFGGGELAKGISYTEEKEAVPYYEKGLYDYILRINIITENNTDIDEK